MKLQAQHIGFDNAVAILNQVLVPGRALQPEPDSSDYRLPAADEPYSSRFLSELWSVWLLSRVACFPNPSASSDPDSFGVSVSEQRLPLQLLAV